MYSFSSIYFEVFVCISVRRSSRMSLFIKIELYLILIKDAYVLKIAYLIMHILERYLKIINYFVINLLLPRSIIRKIIYSNVLSYWMIIRVDYFLNFIPDPIEIKKTREILIMHVTRKIRKEHISLIIFIIPFRIYTRSFSTEIK